MAKVHILFVCFVFCCNIMPVTLIYCKFSQHSREILWNICLIYVQAYWVFYRVICSWESILIVTSSVCVVQKFSLNYDAMLKNTWHHNNYLLTRSDNSVVYKYRIYIGVNHILNFVYGDIFALEVFFSTHGSYITTQ